MPAASARRLIIPAALLAAALVSCHTFPTDPNATRWDPPPSQFPLTFVSGRVFQQGTTTPLAGVVVSAEGSSTVTNDAGNYALDGVRASQTMLVAAKDGFDTLRVSLVLNGSNQTYNVFLRPQQ